jgi:peptidoglycan LD-endopeptidase LytH
VKPLRYLAALALATACAVPVAACAEDTSDLARLRARDLAIPVQSVTAAQLADTYLQERGGGERAHEALDIMAPRGTPVLPT